MRKIMKVFILSLILGLSFTSVTTAKTGFFLEKNKIKASILTENIVNTSLYSGGYQSCIDECDTQYDYDYTQYCSGGYYDTQVCEILIDELYACYDYCDSSYP